jgi:hypothetical protein
MTRATAYFGGTDRSMWVWSANNCPYFHVVPLLAGRAPQHRPKYFGAAVSLVPGLAQRR